MSSLSPLQGYWEREYESTDTPFDAEEPDEWIATLERGGGIQGDVLDAGCGPGRTAFYLANRGYSVLGVDISVNAIERAKRKALEKGNSARFRQADLCTFSGYDRHFDTVVDIGCFHSLEAADQASYAAALHRACRIGAVVYLRAFSVNSPTQWKAADGKGSPALSEAEIRTPFSSNGWAVTDLVEREIALFIPGMDEKPKKRCWFAEIHYA